MSSSPLRANLSAALTSDPAPSSDRAPLARKIPGVTTAAQRTEVVEARPVLRLRLEEVDEVLPEGGLPRGAVIELAARAGHARSTSLALEACASAQAEAKLRGGEATAGAWCAWIEPGSEASVKRGSAGATLFAPA